MLLSHDKNNYINEIKSERRIFPKGKFHTSCTQRQKILVIKTQIYVFLTLLEHS